MVRASSGYTLVELLVTLGVISFIAAMTLFGLSQYNNGQQVLDVRREFVANIRGVQNKVNNGADGSQYKVVSVLAGNQYNLAGTVITLPANITVSPTNIYLCFINPKVPALASGLCGTGTCASPGNACTFAGADRAFFACSSGCLVGYSPVTDHLDVTFSNGTVNKVVTIEGSATNINRIYEQP
jgi:prepilin-type N-terminal cleavage/methylation domain-containing protein